MSTKIKKHKSSIADLDANIVAIISYIGGGVLSFVPGLYYFSWAIPLVIYIMEKKSTFVKKHAIQSLSLQIVSSVLMLILYVIIGGIIRKSYAGNPWAYVTGVFSGFAIISTVATVISIVIGVFVIIALIKAYNYEEYSMPLIGKITKFSEDSINKIAGNNKEK